MNRSNKLKFFLWSISKNIITRTNLNSNHHRRVYMQSFQNKFDLTKYHDMFVRKLVSKEKIRIIEKENKIVFDNLLYQTAFNILHASSFPDDENANDTNATKNTENKPDPYKKPSRETLNLTKECLIKHILYFMKDNHSYKIYTPDIIFENFYSRPQVITEGLLKYIAQMKLIKFRVQTKYTFSKIEIIKITIDENENSIRVRWRLRGLKRALTPIQFFRKKSWTLNSMLRIDEEWHDGFSIFYVRNDGLIYKHKVQKLMPDDIIEYDRAKNRFAKVEENIEVTPSFFSFVFDKK